MTEQPKAYALVVTNIGSPVDVMVLTVGTVEACRERAVTYMHSIGSTDAQADIMFPAVSPFDAWIDGVDIHIIEVGFMG